MCSHLRSSSSIPSKEPCPLWYMSNIRLLSASLKRTATAHGTRQREHFSKHRQPRRAEPNQLHPCVRLWRQPTCAQTHMPRVSLSLRAHGGGSPLMCTASGGDSTDDGSRNSAEQNEEAKPRIPQQHTQGRRTTPWALPEINITTNVTTRACTQQEASSFVPSTRGGHPPTFPEAWRRLT